MLTDELKSSLLERFLRYVKIWTTSDSVSADKGIQPSTQRQFDLARVLEEELKSFGLQNVQITDHCYVYGFLPASKGFENQESFCLLAHMDTVEEVSGQNVNPLLSTNKAGDTIIKTDGTTLLGADDKAGVSEIMTALEYFYRNPEVLHGPVEVCFSPDEETGHGMDNVPLNLIKSKYAYTVDGGSLGELETECFNAFKSEITFTGVSVHTGTARGVMVNAVTMASAFVSALPRHESPETTDGYEGFYAPMSIEGSIENAKVVIFLRDFESSGMEKRKALVETLANATALAFGGKAEVVHTQQYLNMKNGFASRKDVIEKLVDSYRKAGVEPVFTPIRGGTDGSRLTEMGIPCPNIFTGGHNFHSREEWANLSEMSKAAEILINLCGKN
ncbi:peptidase T [Treponema sp.]|uniref:peptidase T n=1 Tax=Treponema sp. TaxID=166 RepID=UPI003890259B